MPAGEKIRQGGQCEKGGDEGVLHGLFAEPEYAGIGEQDRLRVVIIGAD
jgi:hypothetical protein